MGFSSGVVRWPVGWSVCLLVMAGCGGKDQAQTGAALTITRGLSLDAETPLDELRVRARLGKDVVREAVLTLEGKSLADTETANLLFAAADKGKEVDLRVDALQGELILASGRNAVTLVKGRMVPVVVELSRCAAALGEFCDGEKLVTCDPATDLTAMVDCPFGCNADLGRCNACAPGTLECHGDDFIVCDASGQIANTDDCAALGGACRVGSCTSSGCALTTAADGTDCDDGFFCSTGTTCNAGVCGGGAPFDCDDANPCTFDSCDEGTQTCSHDEEFLDGVPCQDGSYCLLNKRCVAGLCGGGTSRNCDDDNDCTLDTCDEAQAACAHDHVTDGAGCDDKDYCTAGETCTAGICGTGAPRACNDSNPCTTDSCDSTAATCLHADADDGSFCVTNKTCANGICAGGGPRSCTDSNPCTFDTCNEALRQCAYDPAPLNGQSCDDGSYCLVNKACAAGTCAGGLLRNCDDGNTCTADSCDEGSRACVNTDRGNGANCDDGDFCTVGEVCTALACGGGATRNCADTNPCTTDSCDTPGATCRHADANDGADCDDGSFCIEGKTCSSGVCSGGTPISCTDTNPCTFDTCNEGLRQCGHDPAPLNGQPCDDGSYCLVNKTCAAGSCAGGVTRNCDDNNTCTNDSCDEGSRACVNADRGNGTNCDDGDFCTIGEVCTALVCGNGATRSCDDNNACTSDTCDSALAVCLNADVVDGTSCEDGSFCTESTTCVLGACGGGSPKLCADTNACTFDYCDEIGRQCQFDPAPRNGAPCSSGNYCTLAETCSAGSCTGGVPRDCNDSDSCTVDSCNSGTLQCDHTYRGDGAVCDDGLFCTVNERCTAGVCTGTTSPCDDGNPCTADSCDDGIDACDAQALPPSALCADAAHLASCDGSGGAPFVQFCPYGCESGVCNECLPSGVECRGDIGLFCYAEITCGGDGRVLSKSCCGSNRCSCAADSCLEATCDGSPVLTGDKAAPASPSLGGTTCTGWDNIPGDCSPGGLPCNSVGSGGAPEAMFQVSLPDGSDAVTTFYDVVLDSSTSGFDTTVRLSRVCTSEQHQFSNADTCAASPTFAVSTSCASNVGVKEKIKLCGVPEGTYFGAVDGATGTCGNFTLNTTLTPRVPDRDTSAGNITAGGVFRGSTCGLADNYAFPDFIATTCPQTEGSCYKSGSTVYCPACGPGAATDCSIASGSIDGLCGFNGGPSRTAVPTPDAVFYLALPVQSGVDLSTVGSRFDTVLYLLQAGPTGASPPGPRRICNDDCFSINGPSHIQTVLPAGLYFVVVDGTAGQCGDYQLNVDVAPASVCGDQLCDTRYETCSTCALDCPCPHCGDGLLQQLEGEFCDDGNRKNGDGCTDRCVSEPNFACWGTPSICYQVVSFSHCPDLAVPDGDPAGVVDTITVSTALPIYDVTLNVDLSHTFIGDLTVNLVAPTTGDSALVHNRSGGSADNIIGTYDTTLTPDSPATMTVFDGDPAAGVWQLEVADFVGSDTGTLNCWGLSFVKGASCGNGICEFPLETCAGCFGDCPCNCGDGILETTLGEQCDDHDSDPGDGCDSTCLVEPDYQCIGEPSVCRSILSLVHGPGLGIVIPDDSSTGVSDTIVNATACTIRDITVDLDIRHTWIGDLNVDLFGPTGIRVVLHDQSGSSTDNIVGTYDQTLLPVPPEALEAFIGTSAVGDWRLFAKDEYSPDEGTIESWGINILCE